MPARVLAWPSFSHGPALMKATFGLRAVQRVPRNGPLDLTEAFPKRSHLILVVSQETFMRRTPSYRAAEQQPETHAPSVAAVRSRICREREPPELAVFALPALLCCLVVPFCCPLYVPIIEGEDMLGCIEMGDLFFFSHRNHGKSSRITNEHRRQTSA